VIAAETINVVLGVIFGTVVVLGIARGVAGWLANRAKGEEDEE
jgi:hypothetical protein